MTSALETVSAIGMLILAAMIALMIAALFNIGPIEPSTPCDNPAPFGGRPAYCETGGPR